MLEVSVVFQQALDDLVALFVVDEVSNVIHQDLDDIINHINREILHADVEYSAAVDVHGEVQSVGNDLIKQVLLEFVDLLRIFTLALVAVLQLFEFGLEPFLY